MAKPSRITRELLADELRYELDNKVGRFETIDWERITNKPQLSDGSWKPPVPTPADLPLDKNDDGDIRLTLDVEKLVFTWSSELSQWLVIGANDTSIDWGHIQNKPLSFPPITHQHKESDISDLDKYTKAEVDGKLDGKSNTGHTHAYSELTDIPTQFQPISHTHVESDIIGLDKYTKSEVDAKLSNKANTSHTHTIASVTNLQSTLDSKVSKITGKSLSTNDFTNELKIRLESLSDSASIDYATMNNSLITHTSNSNIHMTQVEKDLLATVADKVTKSYVDTALIGKASASVVDGHIDNSTIHITQAERNTWNAGGIGKANLSGDTFTGNVTMPTAILPHTTTPTTQFNGQVWTTTSAMFVRLSGSNRQLATTSTWTTVSQSIAEAGISSVAYLWSAERVHQAIKALETPSTSVGGTQPTNGADMWYKEI